MQKQQHQARDIMQEISHMSNHRYECEGAGNYVEAEMAHVRCEELKQENYDQKMEELKFNQDQQR